MGGSKMNGRMKTLAAMMLAADLLATAGGCNVLGYFGYLVAPAVQTKSVPAEYTGLAGKTVAVVIYADQQVQYEYPYSRLGLTSMLNAELKKHVKDAKVVDPRRIIKHQDENAHWDAGDKAALGKAFGADAVLYVIIDHYAMREPGSVGLFRGQISGQARVYDAALPESQALVWKCDQLGVVFPEHAPTGELGENDSKIRYETEKRFAEMVVNKFHKTEVKLDEE